MPPAALNAAFGTAPAKPSPEVSAGCVSVADAGAAAVRVCTSLHLSSVLSSGERLKPWVWAVESDFQASSLLSHTHVCVYTIDCSRVVEILNFLTRRVRTEHAIDWKYVFC